MEIKVLRIQGKLWKWTEHYILTFNTQGDKVWPNNLYHTKSLNICKILRKDYMAGFNICLALCQKFENPESFYLSEIVEDKIRNLSKKGHF